MFTPVLQAFLFPASTHVHSYVYLGSHAHPQTCIFCKDLLGLLYVMFLLDYLFYGLICKRPM